MQRDMSEPHLFMVSIYQKSDDFIIERKPNTWNDLIKHSSTSTNGLNKSINKY